MSEFVQKIVADIGVCLFFTIYHDNFFLFIHLLLYLILRI